ncbi:MAG TPA: efflux RND transporter permease subunit, partial [Humisphaera sp.]|nr:efflux RND transporter permease subunit [Humisphaera sp.]
MIAKLIKLSVNNKLLVLLATAALLVAGIWSIFHSSIDAIPDLSDVQVIVLTDYAGQAPQVVEDQVTYPLTTALAGVGAKSVRGFSMFETSMVYVIFPDGTSLRDARERVLEYLNYARDRLPAGVEPRLGPDATGVGWVYQYVLHPGYYDPAHPRGLWRDEGRGLWYAAVADAPADRRSILVKVRAFDAPGISPLGGAALLLCNQDLASLRSVQDWYLRYPLTGVPGVAEVASIGGFVKEYQVVLKPEKLLAFNISIRDLMMAIQRSNNDVGGSVIEMSENEYMIRSRAYLRGLSDLAKVPVGMAKEGTPIFLKDIATLQIAGEERRGIGEWNGQGEAVSGIVIARYGANAWQVIKDAKAKLVELEDGLPPGVAIQTAYDRSQLIERSIHTLSHTLLEEMIVVSLICLLFLLHGRSALVAIFVIPCSMLASLLIMSLLGINANIMSLGGIAIAIGVVVDSAIVMIENAHKHLNREEHRLALGEPPRPRAQVILEAAIEVGPSLFFSLLIITVSFLPVFVLGGESGRLFKPLAYTKTFAMAAAAILSVTVIPVLMIYLITPRLTSAVRSPIARVFLHVAVVVIGALVVVSSASAPGLLGEYRVWIVIGACAIVAMLVIPQRIIHEERNPISRALQLLYEPFFRFAIGLRWPLLILAVAFIASAIWPFRQL